MIYLDYNATTPVDPRVLEGMLPCFREAFGNASARQHALGRNAAQAVERARQQVADLLGAGAKDILFTAGATESNNLALKGAARWYGAGAARGRHILTSAIEHKSVLETCRRLEQEGFQVTYLEPSPEGLISADQVAQAVRPDTILVSIMWANNEIGTINDIPAIGRFCKEKSILFHTDATQYVGRHKVDVQAAGVDLLSLSAHKIYGPKGAGALYVRRRGPHVRLQPLLDGGGHERGLRSGTLNSPGIVGLGLACEICGREMEAAEVSLTRLRDRLEQGILERLEDVRINGHTQSRLYQTTNLSFSDLDAQAILQAMPEVAASSGAACTTASGAGATVLRRLGLGEARARSSLRFSLGRWTTPAEIEQAIELIVQAVGVARNRGPLCQPT